MLGHAAFRIQQPDPFFGSVHLCHANGGTGGNDLPVQIRCANGIVVDQVQRPDTASCQSLHGIAANAANAEYGYPCLCQPFHSGCAEK